MERYKVYPTNLYPQSYEVWDEYNDYSHGVFATWEEAKKKADKLNELYYND